MSSSSSLATQSRGKTGLFFVVIVGLQNGFYRNQRSPVDGCFSERWPSEPSPEVCNILYPPQPPRPRQVRRLSVRELYYEPTRVLTYEFLTAKVNAFRARSLSGRRRTIIYCLSYIHNGREIFTPKHGWTFSPSFQKQNKCNILSPASRKSAPPPLHVDAVGPEILCIRYFDIFGLCCTCIHRI